jgi:hypothetical protein
VKTHYFPISFFKEGGVPLFDILCGFGTALLLPKTALKKGKVPLLGLF